MIDSKKSVFLAPNGGLPTGNWDRSELVEYRRADLPPTQEALASLTSEQIMADPRVMALVEALQRAKHNVPAFYTRWHSDASTALAALTDNGGETE